jgi:hypothetical protein
VTSLYHTFVFLIPIDTRHYDILFKCHTLARVPSEYHTSGFPFFRIPTKPPTNHEMEIRPVPVVGSAQLTYRKGPQRSGGHAGFKRFFMGVRGAAAAASQARPLEKTKIILAAPHRTSWYIHEKSPKTGVTA